MAYGKKYNFYFYWNHNSSNNYYEVAFYEDGYASTVTELTPSANPFEIYVKGQKDSTDKVILGSAANIEFIVDKSDVDTIDGDFMSISYKDIIVKLIEDPSGTPIDKWVGILLPQSSQRDFLGYKFTYSFEATDGLGALKKCYYSSDGTKTGSVTQGFNDMLSIIKEALSKVADFSELQLDFRVQLGTFSDQMVSTENALKENEIPEELFYEADSDGNNVPDTCEEVLNKIIGPFNCVMAQVDGYYQIWNPQERSSYYFEYLWSTLVQQSRTARNRTITFQGVSNPYELFGRGSLTKLPSLNRHIITLYNKEYATEKITNGNFDSNITGWTNGDADDSSNTWTSLAWYDYPGLGGTLGASWSGAASAGLYNFHQTSSFNLSTSGGNVFVSLFVELNSETRSGSSDHLIQIRLWNSTNGYISGTLGQQTVYQSGFLNITETFTAASFTVAANYLDVEIQVQDATTTAVQFYFDTVTLTQLSGDLPSDHIHGATASALNEYETKERTIYIADQQESTSDLCAIKDSGGTYTSTWDRYSETDTLPLTKILHQQHFNERSGFKDYINLTTYDPNQTIEIFSLLYMAELNLGVRYFDIVGMRKNYRDATIELDLKQSGAQQSDVAYYSWTQKLNTQYGEDIES